MIVLGIDPDLHTLPICRLEGNRVDFKVLRVSAELKGLAAARVMAALLLNYFHLHGDGGPGIRVVIEAQRIVSSGGSASFSSARPEDIALVSFVSGAATAAALQLTNDVLNPTPNDWKGGVPKKISQARIAAKQGWEVRQAGGAGKGCYCVPTDPAIVKLVKNAGDWKHAFDALGLAQWGASARAG